MYGKEYLIKIGHHVFPELKTFGFFATVKGVEHYFSGLVNTDVKIIYRSFYDEFDYAFSLQCTFSLCDKKTEARWIRQEGSEHFFETPPFFVVERNDFSCSPEQVVKRMHSHYRANTLVLGAYSFQQYKESHLGESMRRCGVHMIMRMELDVKSINQYQKPESQIRRLDSEGKQISKRIALSQI